MILDFSVREIMRLSNIKRWGIVEMARSQSVAEHSYNVAMISLAIASEIEVPWAEVSRSEILYWALLHDVPEVVTGDIPTSLKGYLDVESMERELCPKYKSFEDSIKGTLAKTVVKAADYIEALQFAEKFCVDSRKNEIIYDIQSNMVSFLDKKENIRVALAVEKLDFE
jgi:5'-deoxynucleotidase YfbR-like HD superfamily hydrolase